jgi:hypothetical protein
VRLLVVSDRDLWLMFSLMGVFMLKVGMFATSSVQPCRGGKTLHKSCDDDDGRYYAPSSQYKERFLHIVVQLVVLTSEPDLIHFCVSFHGS